MKTKRSHYYRMRAYGAKHPSELWENPQVSDEDIIELDPMDITEDVLYRAEHPEDASVALRSVTMVEVPDEVWDRLNGGGKSPTFMFMCDDLALYAKQWIPPSGCRLSGGVVFILVIVLKLIESTIQRFISRGVYF